MATIYHKNFEQQYKDILLAKKASCGLPLTFKPTNINPIINYAKTAKTRGFAKVKGKQKQCTPKYYGPSKQQKCNIVCKQQKESWSNNDISTLLTYERLKRDLTHRSYKNNQAIMLEE
jgi:hypothetical protein